MCGEHATNDRFASRIPGSSPRVRGTLCFLCALFALAGIIPACAGNTNVTSMSTSALRDHPRVCGEHDSDAFAPNVRHGSSPRVRGTPGTRYPLRHHAGIIPACAGNTVGGRVHVTCAGDHPRVCGEHTSMTPSRASRMGSSPRVRGTRDKLVRFVPELGIIPACAGNTSFHVDGKAEDHPRVCGEHCRRRGGRRQSRGSSPRVRGTRLPRLRTSPCSRIIPACAGNTFLQPCQRHHGWDHPRVCGEHSMLIVELFDV